MIPKKTAVWASMLVGVVVMGVSQRPANGAEEDPSVNRVIGWLTIGGSSSDVSRRMVGWGLQRRGWKGFVKQVVGPQIEWGCRRFVVGNPFGMLPDKPMQFDQYIHAREAGLKWLYEDFVEAWRPITMGEDGPKVEVICYLGKLRNNPDFEPLLVPGKYDDWLLRAWLSMQPALDAGMSIALDASAPAKADHPVYKLAELLRSLGVKVYIEARPPRTHQHWFNYPVICLEKFWHRSDPAKHPDAAIWAANDQLKGEVIRLAVVTPKGAKPTDTDWVAPMARRILSEGHTVAVPVISLIREGVKLESLFDNP